MNHPNVDSLVRFTLRSTNYNQDQWNHPCGAGACLAGETVEMAGLEPGEVMVLGNICKKMESFDEAVAKFWKEHDGANLLILSGDSNPRFADELNNIRRDHSVMVEEVADRAARVLGVDRAWLEETKLFFPRPDTSWPFPYDVAWRATVNRRNPERTVLQRSLAVSYLLSLQGIERDMERSDFFRRGSATMAGIETKMQAINEHLTGLSRNNQPIYNVLQEVVYRLREEREELRKEMRKEKKKISDRHLGVQGVDPLVRPDDDEDEDDDQVRTVQGGSDAEMVVDADEGRQALPGCNCDECVRLRGARDEDGDPDEEDEEDGEDESDEDDEESEEPDSEPEGSDLNI